MESTTFRRTRLLQAVKKAKVLVAGGGPAGSAAAAALAENGVEVLLAERDMSFVKPCGGGIPSPGFRELGLPESLVSRRVSAFRLVAPSGTAVDIPLSEDLFIVDRAGFDTYLRNRALAKGAEVIEAEVSSVEKTRGAYRVLMVKGDQEVVCEAEYLVAADGVNSRLRAAAGLRPAPGDAKFAVTERVSGHAADRCEFWFSRSVSAGMYAWIFPAPDGAGIGTGGTEGRSLPDKLNRFKEKAGLGRTTGRTRMFRIPVWRDGPYHAGKMLFCGDAAGQVMPLSYEGIYYAMKAGAYAAEAVLEGSPSAYRRRWRAEFGRVFGISARLEAFFLKDDASAERLVGLHRRPEVQEIAQSLWLLKQHRGVHVLRYLRLIGKLFA